MYSLRRSANKNCYPYLYNISIGSYQHRAASVIKTTKVERVDIVNSFCRNRRNAFSTSMSIKPQIDNTLFIPRTKRGSPLLYNCCLKNASSFLTPSCFLYSCQCRISSSVKNVYLQIYWMLSCERPIRLL